MARRILAAIRPHNPPQIEHHPNGGQYRDCACHVASYRVRNDRLSYSEQQKEGDGEADQYFVECDELHFFSDCCPPGLWLALIDKKFIANDLGLRVSGVEEITKMLETGRLKQIETRHSNT